MLLFDVNILLYAFRPDSPEHARIRPWFDEQINSPRPFGMADLAVSGFLRIVTHRRVFNPPEPMERALEFANYLRNRPNSVWITPGQQHWDVFAKLCQDHDVKGKLVPDAWFAALAIESGCTWITTDRDFARFDGLKWETPPQD